MALIRQGTSTGAMAVRFAHAPPEALLVDDLVIVLRSAIELPSASCLREN
jgi:hypothetical protein